LVFGLLSSFLSGCSPTAHFLYNDKIQKQYNHGESAAYEDICPKSLASLRLKMLNNGDVAVCGTLGWVGGEIFPCVGRNLGACWRGRGEGLSNATFGFVALAIASLSLSFWPPLPIHL